MKHYGHVVEIGAGDHYSSDALRMLSSKEISADRVALYEPHPVLFAALSEATRGWPNLTVHEKAVTSHFDPLYLMGYASYLRGNPSFLATSVEPDGEKWWEPLAHEVSCVKVDRMDYGTIDGLILTCGGSEVDVLNHLISRPLRIWTKHYVHNPKQWAEFNKIASWMQYHGYRGIQLETNQYVTFLHLEWRLNGS